MKRPATVVVALALASCEAERPLVRPPVGTAPIVSLLRVEDVRVTVAESLPPQVTAHVVGQVPDVCTEVRTTRQFRNGNDIRLMIWTERPDGPCILLVPPPVERSVRLDGEFPPGEYVLSVNGFRVVFRV